MLLSPLREPQLYERIAEELATGIRSGVFAPGSRLPSERELARQLQVGRSSVSIQPVPRSQEARGMSAVPDCAVRLFRASSGNAALPRGYELIS